MVGILWNCFQTIFQKGNIKMEQKISQNNLIGFKVTQRAYTLNEAETHNSIMAFSLRKGGCSSGPYESLNFSSSNGDTKTNVTYNLRILSNQLGIENSKIIGCKQEHSDNIVILNDIPQTMIKGDAIIALQPDLYLSIKTADCLPILLIDPKMKISAAIHAGWRGTVLRITKKVVFTLLRDHGCKSENIIVALGPAIGLCCYEVGETVLTPLFSAIPWAEQFTVKSNSYTLKGMNKRRLDLVAINEHELLELGIIPNNIYSIKMCTSCNEDKFFSYRRDGKFSGRNIAIVGFKPDH